MGYRLLTTNNEKIIKSNNSGTKYLSAIMHLAPHKLSGHNVCSSASKGCIAACLNTSGRGRYGAIQSARIRKTLMFFQDRATFKSLLIRNIEALLRKCDREGLRLALRLNGTSDIVWENIWSKLFDMFPQVQFYDYTKHVKRVRADWSLPDNYHLTFSRSENNDNYCLEALANNFSVAAVFGLDKLPKRWYNVRVFNADTTDLRFLDPRGQVGALIAKGRARYDQTGFVIRERGGAMNE